MNDVVIIRSTITINNDFICDTQYFYRLSQVFKYNYDHYYIFG